MNGYGFLRFRNDDTFEGEFSNGDILGYGICKIAKHKRTHIGFHVKGVLLKGITIQTKDEEHNYFISNMECGAATGFGKAEIQQGVNYKGEFKNGKYNGYGELIVEGNYSYKGEFKDGKPCGYGIVHHSNGDILEGEFGSDLRDHHFGVYLNGFGVYKKHDGAILEAEFKNGEVLLGKYIYPEGDIRKLYQGDWSCFDKEKTTYGTLLYSNGDYYEGEFKNELMDGYGEMKYEEGFEYSGTWKKDKKDGIGICTLNENIKFLTKFKEDKIDLEINP